jgi:hypothetical protein
LWKVSLAVSWLRPVSSGKIRDRLKIVGDQLVFNFSCYSHDASSPGRGLSVLAALIASNYRNRRSLRSYCGAIQAIIDRLNEAGTNAEPRLLANRLHRLPRVRLLRYP